MSQVSSARYYHKNKESFQRMVLKGINSFPKEKEKWEYGRERYKSLPAD